MSRMTYSLPMMVSRVGLTFELHLLSLFCHQHRLYEDHNNSYRTQIKCWGIKTWDKR